MATASDPKPPKYALMKKAALALPGTVEVIDRHGHWFNIGKKTFALYGMHSDGKWILRLPKDQVRMLSEADPDVFSPMIAGALLWAYVDVTKLNEKELRGYVTVAWRHLAPKKLQAQLEAE